MEVYFLSSNKNKIKEVKEILLDVNIKVKPINLKINEIQSLDMTEIVRDKALKAFKKIGRPVLVEQTGLLIKNFGNLPGGLTQIFWDSLEKEKFCEIFSKNGYQEVIAKTILGFCDGKKIEIFEGEIEGNISSSPYGDETFQWDCVFIPKGCTETFAQLGTIKNEISMRRIALDKLKEYFKNNMEISEMNKNNMNSINKLKKDICNGKVILFVGAGVSATLGLPTWEQLISEISNQMEFNDRVFKLYGNSLTLAEYYYIMNNGIGKLRSWMDKNWDISEDKIKKSKIYKSITKLKFPLIYTTNYDQCLETAFDAFGKKYKKIVDVDDLVNINLDHTQIIKFHGDTISDDSIVLTETSYFERLNFESPLDIKLRADMLGKSILFIGYSLSDINIRLLVYKLDQLWKNSNKLRRPVSYIFLPTPNIVQQEIMKRWGIIPIVGDEIDKTKSIEKFLHTLE